MSTVEIDGVGYEVAPEVAGLLQAVSEERDELQGIGAGAIPKAFLNELTQLINRHSIENEVDMPDFVLAGMICRMIEAIGPSIKKTLDWHGCASVCHPSPNASLSIPGGEPGYAPGDCSAPADNGIPELDALCTKYNAREISICALVCRIWNTAYHSGQNGQVDAPSGARSAE